MKTIFSFLRISMGLTSLTLCVLLVAQGLGLVPDADRAILRGRLVVAEAVAIHASVAIQRHDVEGLEAAFRAELEHDPELASLTLWGPAQQLLAAAGELTPAPETGAGGYSTPTDVRVPVALDADTWGMLNLHFRSSPWSCGAWGGIGTQSLLLIGFVTLGCCAVHGTFLWRALRNARKIDEEAVPKRVRAALNTLAEGVLILDRDQRIALSNEAFAQLVNKPISALEGRLASELSWEPSLAGHDLPWDSGDAHTTPQLGVTLRIAEDPQQQRTVSVNIAPVIADDGSWRGTLATFDDLTNLEKKNTAMRRLLARLKRSRAEIQRRNHELRELATRDPLTSCLNRRAFFAQGDALWTSSASLGAIMVDVDHFKSVNDRHGHAAGDQVLVGVGATLRSTARESDLVCRYGGEEFCVLVSGVTLDEAQATAERIRTAIQAATPGGITVSASLGVSTTELGARDLHTLIDQADKALYASKRNGRNRVTRHDELPTDFTLRSDRVSPQTAVAANPIPFPAVSALLSALAYRDASTAEHSLRVADLCVSVAKGILSRSQCYILEVAALLHDIGKLGIPDAVLKKPGPLTPDEWTVIRTHESIGEEILTAAFMSDELTTITRNHHASYGGSAHDPSLPSGEDIPIGARLLSIADAFDAMVSDRCYRKGRSHAAAFAELRRCGGTQFDPKLVERFIAVVEARECRGASHLQLSKQTALRVGMQIESLAAALDAKDKQTLATMLNQLAALARDNDIADIGTRVAGLQDAVAAGADWLVLTTDALDLMDICRAAYDSYLPAGSSRVAPASRPKLALA
jgi:diguanylate cyclase (GGDEF)-like protein/putative nucleotidyltransferase with HDIG domain